MSTRASMIAGTILGTLLLAVLIGYGLWWLATGSCLESGGSHTLMSCEYGSGSSVSLLTLVPLSIGLASVVFVLAVLWRVLRFAAGRSSRPGI